MATPSVSETLCGLVVRTFSTGSAKAAPKDEKDKKDMKDMKDEKDKKDEGASAPEALLPLRQLVECALKTDRKARVPGTTSDLFGLSDMKRPLKLHRDGTIPVLTKFGDSLARQVITKDRDFAIGFRKIAPWTSSLTWTGLIAAGGSVSHVICRSAGAPADIDFFLVGGSDGRPTETEARARITHLRDTLAVYWKQWGYEMITIRRKHCITFIRRAASLESNDADEAGSVQVILKAYCSISEVLHDFDLGSSAMAYDGRSVFFSSLGRLAYEHDLNVLDLDRRRASYERRIAKYHYRGYDLALPHLDRRGFGNEDAFGEATIGLLQIRWRSKWNTSGVLCCDMRQIKDTGLPAAGDNSYGDGGFNTRGAIALLNWNLVRSDGDHAITSLCAMSTTTADDPTRIPVSLADLEPLIHRLLIRTNIRAERLIALLGKETAAHLVSAVILEQPLEIAGLLACLDKHYASKLDLPFELEQVGSDALGQPRSALGVRPIDPKLWYGAHYMPTPFAATK